MDRILVSAVTVSVVLAAVLAFVPIGTVDGGPADSPALNGQSSPDVSAAAPPPDDDSTTGGYRYLAAINPQPTEDTTARLVVPPERIDRAGAGTVTVDVGSTLQSDVESTENRYEYHLLRTEYQAAPEEDREALLDDEITHLESRVEDLQTREEDALQQYSEGELSTTEFVTVLALVHEEAQGIEMRLDGVDRLDDQRTFSNRTIASKVVLQRLQGPVRERVGAAIAAEEPPMDVYVEATHDGVVLSTLDDGEYVREAHAHWNVDDDPDRRISHSEATNRFENRYPWAWGATDISSRGIGGDLLYQGSVSHEQGKLTTYIDGGSGDVIIEYQYLEIDAMPISQTVVAEGDGPDVTLERTYAGGPARIETGTDAEVKIDGEHVATTEDGDVWIVEPRPPYELSVTANGEPTNVTVDGQAGERLPGE